MEQFDDRDAFVPTQMIMVGPNMVMGKVHCEFVNGNDVCTIYDCIVGPATVSMAEWIHVENGRIAQIRLVFDFQKFGQ